MNINGRVTKSDTGKQLRGAKVTLFIGDSELAVLYTDRKGRFEHTESEDYIGETLLCKVRMDDYKPQEVKQQIEGEGIDLDIQLIPVRQDKPVSAPPKRDWMKIGTIAVAVLLGVSNVDLLMTVSNLKSNIPADKSRVSKLEEKVDEEISNRTITEGDILANILALDGRVYQEINIRENEDRILKETVDSHRDDINSINISIAELESNSWQKAVGGRSLIGIHQMFDVGTGQFFYVRETHFPGLTWARHDGLVFYGFW